jgi:mono/diheme cytochrome c family protein
VAIILGVVAGLAVAVVIGIFALSQAKIARTYDIPPVDVAIPSGPEAVARGQHLTEVIFQCSSCHGEDLSGQVLFEDFLTGRLAPSNLTSGEGGVGRTYTDQDWLRAIRHGVLPNGRAGIAMLSNVFYPMSDADLGAMVAYLKSVPPVDKVVPTTRLGLMGRVFVLQQEHEILPASGIDHAAAHPPSPQPGVTVEYGAYMANVCTFCHGPNYAGAPPEMGTEENPAPRNLTPAGDLANWTEADFISTLRTGKTPEGRELNPEAMPWQAFGKMTDDELKAVWLFLKTLPPAQPQAPGGE